MDPSANTARPAAPGEMRFLQYESAEPIFGGLLHHVPRLETLLREAQATARLAILPPLHLYAHLNLGVSREWRWEHYFDFAASSLTYAGGRRFPLPIADCRPGEGVRTLRLRAREPMPERACNYPLVVRRIPRNFSFRKEFPVDALPAAAVDLRPSARAAALARQVVRHLRALGGGRFAAVHVRRGDRIAFGEVPDRLTSPQHIRQRLRHWGAADGAVVYIASDERDPDFWRPLQETYRLFRYVDFPQLEALISGVDEAPDNYLLFQVEREVLREGYLRIGTIPNWAWAHMHDWFIDRENWPPRPSFSRRLSLGARRLVRPLRRIEECLPQAPSRMLASARLRAAAFLRRFE